MASRKKKQRSPNGSIVTMPRRILGLDLSLNATGLAVTDTATMKRVHSECIRSKGARAATRIRALTDRVLLLAHQYGCDEVVAEAFFIPQRKRAAGAVETLWLHGVICVDLVLSGLPPPLYVPGSTLRKWTTGNGKAEKPDMRAAILRDHKVDIDDDNECDAFALTVLGIAYNRWRVGDTSGLDAYQLDAVTKWERAFGISDDDE